jgi:DNA-binding FadR family transcriptional regulator
MEELFRIGERYGKNALPSKSSDDMMKRTNHLLQRHSLADAVVSKLQQQLSLGEYQPGEKLPSEPELMEQFGVGRSTIREAIRILANSGLLSVRQGSGTYVQQQTGIAEPLSVRLKRADTKDLDEVRQLLEMKIAQRAALHRSQKDIEKMKLLLKKRDAAARAGDTEAAILADIQFHVTIAAAGRNDILADLYRTFAEQLTRHFRQLHQNTEAFISTQSWHESLLKSIVDQDPEKAWHWSSKIVAH